MIRATGLLAALLTTGLVACGGPKEEAVAPAAEETTQAAAHAETDEAPQDAPAAVQAYVDNLTKVAGVLATVHDEPTAHAAAQQLQPIFDDMKKQTDALEAADEQKAGAAMLEMDAQLTAAQQKIAVAMSNWALNKPELMEIVGPALEKMPEIDN